MTYSHLCVRIIPIKKGFLDMKIIVTIDFDQVEEFSNYFGEDFLSLNFNSFDAFNRYLVNPQKITIDKHLLLILSPKERKQFLFLKRRINKQLPNLIKLIYKENIQVLNIKPKDLVKFSNDSLTYTVNLKHLSLSEVMEILQYPWPTTTMFLDKFNQIEAVSQANLISAYKMIEQKASLIKPMNPSPAEIAFYAFDMARDRVFKKSSEEDNQSIGRDLCSVINKEEIVCAGYVNLFTSLCEFLGVPADYVLWANKQDDEFSHASSFVYINDPKYNLCGIYAFEPTWNRKKGNDDQKFLLDCRFAFVPLKQEITLKGRKNFELADFDDYSIVLKRLNRFQKFLSFGAPQISIDDLSLSIARKINALRNRLGLSGLNDKDLSIEELESGLMSLEGEPIPVKTFREIIVNVRTYEHAIYPDKYATDEHSIDTLLASSFSFKFEKERKKARELILKLLLDESANLE